MEKQQILTHYQNKLKTQANQTNSRGAVRATGNFIKTQECPMQQYHNNYYLSVWMSTSCLTYQEGIQQHLVCLQVFLTSSIKKKIKANFFIIYYLVFSSLVYTSGHCRAQVNLKDNNIPMHLLHNHASENKSTATT